MSIQKEIPELLKAGVINQETASRILDYYRIEKGTSNNRFFIVFGVLGAIITGLGIILIIAHNWDELSRFTRTIFAFLPLVIGQILCAYVLMKRRQSTAWREAGAAFLFFAVGASISLVSQVYNIPGNLGSFLLTWMLLCFPLIYVMRSSIVSLLYLAGITFYACEIGYWSFPTSFPYLFWPLFLLITPHYYLFREKSRSNFINFHNWLVPLSLVIVLGAFSKYHEEFMFTAYISLLGLLYLIGDSEFFRGNKLRNNGYKIIGSLGTVGLLLASSFDWFWESLRRKDLELAELINAPEFLAFIIISLLAMGMFYFNQKNRSLIDIKPLSPIFILFMITFFLGFFSSIAVVLINIYILGLGILIIREGGNQNHLGILNFGLLIITALVTCRFFDTDLSFVFRGIMFVLVGTGFFAANYWLLKKRKVNE
ncbi:DUF2157 domain-containing protein [Gramella sp. MT6]|uniref:DUF2157 domain-containing protein n=1 Tax=Gramella sp. MT6 TaxID=2705471 RepID=UPI001C5DF6B4|nr:DUF2157 domain-containing protein [Gramella sp. MT6]QYA24519.1 DUF2157 domain-containing protein [Gramella sp. MT6]